MCIVHIYNIYIYICCIPSFVGQFFLRLITDPFGGCKSFFTKPATSSVHYWPSITINSHIQILQFWGFPESHFYLRQTWPEVVIESSLTFVQIRWVSMSLPGLQTYRSDPLAAVPWHRKRSFQDPNIMEMSLSKLNSWYPVCNPFDPWNLA